MTLCNTRPKRGSCSGHYYEPSFHQQPPVVCIVHCSLPIWILEIERSFGDCVAFYLYLLVLVKCTHSGQSQSQWLRLTLETLHRCPVMWIHEYISIDWFPYMNYNSVKSLKLLHIAFIYIFFSIFSRFYCGCIKMLVILYILQIRNILYEL